jgi:hypothetical protein
VFAAAERSGAPDVVVGLALRTPPRHWYQATPARAELVRAFVGARLLVEDVDHVRIAHEALLRHWPPRRR